MQIDKQHVEQKILVVDDDNDFQFILQNYLKKEGYLCVGAATVEEALASVRLSPPNLVILDLGLRKASGIAFLQNFAKEVSRSEKIPPVVVVSGYTDPEIIDLVGTLGAARFIPKPVGCVEIVSAIRSLIN